MGKKSYLAIGVVAGLLSYSNSVWAQETKGKMDGKTIVRKSAKVTTPVSMDVKEEVVQDVLSILFEQRAGASVIFDNSVPEKAINLNFKDMAWDQAFELILKVAGLEAEETSPNVFLIKQKRGITTGGEDLTISLYLDKDIDQIPANVLKRMLKGQLPPEQPLNAVEMRDVLRSTNKVYIKSLEVKNRPAVDVIKALVKAADLNFSFSDGLVSTPAPAPAGPNGVAAAPAPALPRVSMNLRGMELEKVLIMVAKKAGYSCIEKDGVWEVSPMKAEAVQPLVVGYFEVRFLAVDKDLIDLLTGLLTGPVGNKRGEIKAGKNKYIVVKATEVDIEAIRRTLEVMDKPTPQVMIEARFFELTEGDGESIGMDWQGIKGDQERITTTGLSGVDFLDSGLLKSLGNTAILSSADFSAKLGMLYSDDNAKNLSNPKIVVASGEQATIHIGGKRPIIKSTTSGTGKDAVTSSELDKDFGSRKTKPLNLIGSKDDGSRASSSNYPGYLDLGTMLTVAPSVKTAEQVYLKVVPILTNEKGEAIATKDGNVYPQLFTTMVQTEFTLKSGQTIAIGGLVKETDTSVSNKVPLLSSIPLLGYLFKYDQDGSSRSETIIFLTVKIMNAKDLKLTSGIPVNSKLAQPFINAVRKSDATGAEYIDIVPKVEEPKKEKKPEVDLDKQLKDIKNAEYGYQKEIDAATAEFEAKKAAKNKAVK